MYKINTNGVKNEVVNSGAIKKLFDGLYDKVGETDFLVQISADDKNGILNYNVKIQSQIVDGDKGFVQTMHTELLTACQEAISQYMRKWRHVKANWKKQRSE